jgi:hypothetical protein
MISSVTGSASVLARVTVRAVGSREDQVAERIDHGCQPGSTTVVADGSMIRAGP